MKTTSLRIRQVNIGGRVYHQVTVPKPGGGRRQVTFKDAKQAKGFYLEAEIQLKRFGLDVANMPSLLREQAIEASKLLEPLGTDILTVAKEYAAARSIQSRPVAEVASELLASYARDGKSGHYLRDLRSKLKAFSGDFGKVTVADITVSQVANWLHDLKVGAIARNGYHRALGVLFSFAKSRGYCASNPMPDVQKAKEPHSPIGILKPDQMQRLLTLASDQTRPYWLIGGFAGLRSAELERLDWKEVHFESGLVEVTAAKAKTARRRFVVMEPNLREWLEPYCNHTGAVGASKLARRRYQEAKAAGIDPWPANALRHSYASYHLAHHNDAARLATFLGHADQNLIYSNYRELVKPSEAERWWSIRP